MAGGMDLTVLRRLVQGVLDDWARIWTHREIAAECVDLGLPEPPPASDHSKRDRVRLSLAALPDADLPAVAERIVMGMMPLSSGPAARFAIEDVLWAHRGDPEIPQRTRREIARELDLDAVTRNADRFMALLDRLWVLDSPLDPWTDGSSSLRGQVHRHVLRNPGDWSAEDLFEQLGAFEAGDARFAQFLEGLASADVVPDEPTQRRVVAVVNPHLRAVGAELRETGTDGGYPVFSVVSTRAAQTRPPKNLIFASPVKPDIRFSDAIDNDIEIVGNADKVLVYDRPIGSDGLRWRDLQAWWKDTQQISDDDERQEVAVSEASALPSRQLAPAAEPVRPIPRDPRPRRPEPPGALARGMAALGPQDGSGSAAGTPCCDSAWTS